MAKTNAGGKGLDRGALKVTLVFLILLVAWYVALKMGYLPAPRDISSGESPIYDTDAQNDRYIKGSLTPMQLRVLDRLLDEEQDYGGRPLPAITIRRLASGDKAVIAAYDRWRTCSEMMRSSNYVIYPRDRGR